MLTTLLVITVIDFIHFLVVSVEYRHYPFSRFHVSWIAFLIDIIYILPCCWFHFCIFLSRNLFWAFTEAGGRKKPSTGTIALPSSRPSIQRHWKQCQKIPISHKLQLNENYVSLIYNSSKVYGNIELNWARCKRILKVWYNLLRLLNLQHPVGKSKLWSMHSNGIVFL